MLVEPGQTSVPPDTEAAVTLYSVMIFEADDVQPFASVAVTVYVPAPLVMLAVVAPVDQV